ncbi:sentrin-specific protease 8 isoform X2 [Hyla sarda]|nr:sentrin-specific protease 8 isoform X2 [Hyla sarda]XP_056425275.1 sentrin-specific protease 8 isoform X2 [Hyla sarda]XP_056425276.1 sentrin-specific protease 8 isoform X2 [Hyla sarda]
MDQVVLSYGDSLLRISDVALLDAPHWLNDNIIGFIFEFLSSTLAPSTAERVALLGPDVSQFIKCCGNDAAEFLQPLEIPRKDLVLLPVNDNAGTEAGGTHWSLLAYLRSARQFLHYDSAPGTNAPHARLMARNLSSLLAGNPRYQEEDAPAQHNSYDCGMYVVCVAQALCEQYFRGCNNLNLENITPQYVTQKRAEWKEIIRELGSHSKATSGH